MPIDAYYYKKYICYLNTKSEDYICFGLGFIYGSELMPDLFKTSVLNSFEANNQWMHATSLYFMPS